MKITASVALSSDGCMDDCTPQRLILSTPEDWQAVYRLRAAHDAILVGAETLRRDNPSLTLHNDSLCRERAARGASPDPVKVTVTSTFRFPADAAFFACGACEKIVFSTCPPPTDFHGATVIQLEEISAAAIVTELEKRGICSLLVEGGATTLAMFFREGLIDTFRRAVNPEVRVGDCRAPHLTISEEHLRAPHTNENLGGMEVTNYTLHPDRSEEDHRYLRLAVEESCRCTPSQGSYCVGAVIVTTDGQIFKGYTHETSPTHHAEQEAVKKALAAGADLRGATIYSSMEPCSTRKSEPESCSAIIARLGFARVIFALYEPDRFAHCVGALNLRRRGIEVRVDDSLADEVRRINAHVL